MTQISYEIGDRFFVRNFYHSISWLNKLGAAQTNESARSGQLTKLQKRKPKEYLTALGFETACRAKQASMMADLGVQLF